MTDNREVAIQIEGLKKRYGVEIGDLETLTWYRRRGNSCCRYSELVGESKA